MATRQRCRERVGELLALRKQEQQPGLYGNTLVVQGRSWIGGAMFFYFMRWLGAFLRFVISSPFALVLNPLDWLYSCILYPFLFIFFGGLGVAFYIFDKLGGSDWLNKIGLRFAPNVVVPSDAGGRPGRPVGYTIANWTDPYVLNASATRDIINDARYTLSGRRPTTVPPPNTNTDFPPTETKRIFDVDVAKTLSWMTALVYERVDGKVQDASVEAANAAAAAIAGNTVACEHCIGRAGALLQESEVYIKEQAARWGLAYEGISDLATLGGPFSSIFYTPVGDVSPVPASEDVNTMPLEQVKKLPFLVLAMKGTTPHNYAEFLVNGTVSTVPAATFFGGGQAHEGYYTSLFNSNKVGVDGYGQILKALKNIAAELRTAAGGPASPRIPLWITGHSLGGCLASLLFARLLHEPRDLGDDIALMDAYNIGTLRVGNGEFVNHFEASLVRPTNRPSILFRLVLPGDFGPRIVPGLADDERNRGILPELSPLNFAHISSATIKFTGSKCDKGYEVVDMNFHTRSKVVVQRRRGPRGTRRSPREDIRALPPNWLRFGLAWFLPSFLFNHFPSSHITKIDQMQLG